MASGVIKSKSKCIMIQGALNNTITVPAAGDATIFNGQNLSTAFSSLQVGVIPTGQKLVGLVYYWSNGGRCFARDTFVDNNGSVTLSLYNPTNYEAVVSSIRLLTFWE